MIRFMKDMDPHSLTIFRGGQGWEGASLGFLQWHPGRPPRILISVAFTEFSLDEMETLTSRLREKQETSRVAATVHSTPSIPAEDQNHD